MRYRLGLDLGTNSIGWSVLEIDKIDKFSPKATALERFSLLAMGVRIFPDGREPAQGGRVGDSLAVARRLARGMRRNRDHGNNRMRYMMERLVRRGLMPQNKIERQQCEALDPYTLRAEALDRPLTRYELGRVLFHLARRRGFKSNRKEQSDADKDEEGMRASQMVALRQVMGNKTLGQFLHQRITDGQPLRFRDGTEWFPDRAMYEEEFDAIKDFQAPHHALLDDEWRELRDNSILFQHPLKPVERGRCSLRPEFLRAHRDTPIAQWFRIYQDLANLRWIDEWQNQHPLSPLQRDAIIAKLLTLEKSKKGVLKKNVSFKAIRGLKHAKERLFPRESTFNLESVQRKQLEIHKIAIMMQNNPLLKPLWETMAPAMLDDIFECLHAAQEDEKLIPELIEHYPITEDQATAFAALPLSKITQTLSRQVMEELLPLIRDHGLGYAEAVRKLTDEAGNPLHHSHHPADEKLERLPYYGEVLSQSVMGGDSSADPSQQPAKHFGRIGNPTVHVALNQLRVVVNSLIKRFGGPPAEINVELSRDLKLSSKKRNEINQDIAKNTKRNAALKKHWEEITKGQPATKQDENKLKLWEELGSDEMARRCVFTGQTIAAHHLINGEVEIEHLLPYSRTLDDSMANLTLAFRGANRAKGNNSPYEAFGDGRNAGFDWKAILERASKLPKAKRWRFARDAMERFEGEHDFIARQLTDNAYISRAAHQYLAVLCANVAPAPGRLTAMIRGKWRLSTGLSGKKSRDDHRHHAIDAFVVALADRWLLQKISTLTAREEETAHAAGAQARYIIPQLPTALRHQFKQRLAEIIISYKPDHGIQGRYFKETAYGVLKDEGKTTPGKLKQTGEEGYHGVTRKPIATLSENELEDIRDPLIRQKLLDYLAAHGWTVAAKDAKDAKDAKQQLPKLLGAFGQEHGIRRLRLLVKYQTLTPVASAPHKAYAPDAFVCCDIWAWPKGKDGKWQEKGKQYWEGQFWNYAECAKGVPDKSKKKPHPAASFKMRLFKDDMVSFVEGGGEHLMRVAGFSTTDNRLDLKPHNSTAAPRRYIGINKLGLQGLKQIFISPDGRYLNQRC